MTDQNQDADAETDAETDAADESEIDTTKAVELAEMETGLPLAAADDRTGTYLDLPTEVVELIERLADERDQHKWQVVSELILESAGGGIISSVSQYKREIEREQQEIGRIEEQIEQRKREIEQLERERCDHEQRIDHLRDGMKRRQEQTRDLNATLDDILDSMAERGEHAAIDVGRVPGLADEWFDGNQRVALDALQSRADETDREIPPSQFSDPQHQQSATGTRTNTGAGAGDLKAIQKLRQQNDDADDADDDTADAEGDDDGGDDE